MKSTKKIHPLEHTEIIPVSTLLKPVVIGGILIPISLFFWVFSALKANYLSRDGNQSKKYIYFLDRLIHLCNLVFADNSDASPLRWLFSFAIPAVIAYRGLKKKSLDLSGAILGKLYKLYFLSCIAISHNSLFYCRLLCWIYSNYY